MDSKHYILPHREDPAPVYLQTTARMLDLTIKELYDQHPELINMLSRVNERILKVKPYGLFQSTQAISTVIELYFMASELSSEIDYLSRIKRNKSW
jgi:hypothetical protein